jgi:prepilin-type N-terminal cleavage/methylation domain-containing protein
MKKTAIQCNGFVGPKGGFTILELLIVVLILGIVAMAGMPTLVSGLEGYRLSAAATEIVTAIEYAQLTAMTAGGNSRITIDSSDNTILVEKFEPGQSLLGAETELDDTVVEGGSYVKMGHPINKGMDYQVSMASEDRFSGVDIVTSVFGAGNFIIFDALGAPSDGGTVTLSTGSRQGTVSVDSLTGKVTADI